MLSASVILMVRPPMELKPSALTRMTAAIIRLRLWVKSTLFSTTLRIPIAEIMPYSMKETPPMIAEGTVSMAAPNFGKKESRMATSAAMRITRGSYTLVSASTPVFSP